MILSENRLPLCANAALQVGIMARAQNKTAREDPAPLAKIKKSDFDQPLRMSGGA
jgi:hypothetical protein